MKYGMFTITFHATLSALFFQAGTGFHFSDVDDGEDGVPAYVLPLRRESVPVVRHNKTVSYKTSYSGLVHMGTPLQEYRVVFDSGSGNLILPDSQCDTDACRTGDKKILQSDSIVEWLPNYGSWPHRG